MRYDLHIYTNISDDKFDKLELLRFCNEKSNVYVINAIELDIVDISHFHMLAYDIKNNEILNNYISSIIARNNNITEDIVKKIINIII